MKKRTMLFTVLAAFATTAAAQLGGGFPGGGGARRGSRGGADRRNDGDSSQDVKPRVDAMEVTLQEFHEDLKLRQEQEAAWQRYADSLRALQTDLSRQAAPRAGADPLPLLQRIDRVVDTARNRLAALEDISDRAKALYQSLSPEQKTTADPRLANLVMQAAGSGPSLGSGPRPRGA